jgi:iron(III) transport system substrate-binding protein
MSVHAQRPRRRALTLGIGMLLLTAACGSDDDEGAASSEPAAVTAAPSEIDPADTTGSTGSTGVPGSASSDTGVGTATTDSVVDTATASDAAWDQVIADATEEGSLVVYSSQSPDPLNLAAEAFEEAYPGIDVEVIRLPDAEVVSTTDTEVSTGQRKASFIGHTALTWIEAKGEEGLFVAPVGPEFAGETGYDAATYVHPGNQFELGASVLTFGWNSDLWSAGISDYPDLLDPALGDGKIGLIDVAIGPAQADFYAWLEKNYGADYLTKLAAQKPRIYPSALPINEALASGEIIASPYTSPFGLHDAKTKGAPVDFGVGAKGAWGAVQFGMILKDAPSPNAAQLWANYVVSEAGQKILTAFTGSVRPDNPDALVTNDQVLGLDLELQQPENLAAYVAKWNELFR